MLSFVNSILQRKYAQALQRRKANVQKQLEFWPAPQRPPQRTEIWEGLDQQQRGALIAALARVISKVVHPENLSETQEDKHER